jgi:hypothetical protein
MRASMLCFAAAVLAALPTIAAASTIPCAPGTIATVHAQGPCTIGALTFDFTQYEPYSYGTGSSPIGATDISFTPLANGFELGGPFSSSVGTNTYEYSFLYYHISVTKSSTPGIVGANVALNGVVLSTAPFPGAGAQTEAGVYAENYLYTVPAYPYQYAFQTQLSDQSPSDFNSTGPQTFAPISSAYGDTFIDTGEYDFNPSTGTYGGTGTASASMASVDYTFQEGVPEPGSIPLLGTMAIALAALTRGMRKRAPW